MAFIIEKIRDHRNSDFHLLVCQFLLWTCRNPPCGSGVGSSSIDGGSASYACGLCRLYDPCSCLPFITVDADIALVSWLGVFASISKTCPEWGEGCKSKGSRIDVYMKVLVLSHMYPSTFNEAAGIFVHEQGRALVAKEIEVKVVSPVPWTPFPINRASKKWNAYSRIPEKAIWDEIEVWYPRYLTFPRAWSFASSGERMYRGIKDTVAEIYREFPFDLIHAHVALPDGYAGVLLTQRFKKPLLVTIHGQDLQHTVARNTACRHAVSYVLDSASRTVLVSQKLRQLASKYLSVRDKLVVVYNGVDPQEVISRPAESINQQEQGPTLLSVSNLVQIWLCLRGALRAVKGRLGPAPLALVTVVAVVSLSLDWQNRKLYWLVLALALASQVSSLQGMSGSTAAAFRRRRRRLPTPLPGEPN